jgi:hypothetical protein
MHSWHTTKGGNALCADSEKLVSSYCHRWGRGPCSVEDGVVLRLLLLQQLLLHHVLHPVLLHLLHLLQLHISLDRLLLRHLSDLELCREPGEGRLPQAPSGTHGA